MYNYREELDLYSVSTAAKKPCLRRDCEQLARQINFCETVSV